MKTIKDITIKNLAGCIKKLEKKKLVEGTYNSNKKKKEVVMKVFTTAVEDIYRKGLKEKLPDTCISTYNDIMEATGEKTKEVVIKKKEKGKKMVDKKSNSARAIIINIIKSGNFEKENIIEKAIEQGVKKHLIGMYLNAWVKGDRCPIGDKLYLSEEKKYYFK